MKQLGAFIRQKREALLENDRSFSQQQVSRKIGIEQSYLSKIERGVATKLSEQKIIALAELLGEDSDYMLALGGKVSADVLGIINQRPRLFSRLVRQMKNMPEDVIEADQDFKQRQSRIGQLHELASIGYFHLDIAPERSVWSPLVPVLLGLPEDTCPSLEAIASALEPESAAEFIAAEQEAFKSFGAYHCEVKLSARKDGHPVWMQIWGGCDSLPGGEATVRLGLIQDVTQHVLFREELKSAHRALSGTVEKQTQQVTQGIDALKREIAARKLLEIELREINDEISRQKEIQRQFYKQGTYELRSLLSQLVAEYDSDMEDVSSSRLGNISAIINNMHDFFEIESGISTLSRPFALKDALGSLMSDLAEIRKNSDLNLQLELSPNLPERIKGDRQRLQQIIHSIIGALFVNTPWGTVQLTIDYIADNKSLYMSFTTSAAKQILSREAFYPVSESGGEEFSWMLTTVGPIVDALQGTLNVDHTPSNGVLISIQIPCEPAERQCEEVMNRLPVLVVEDDEFSRLYAEKTLVKIGFDVECVALGNEALNRLEKDEFALVILDIQLPDVDGVTIAGKIRSGHTPNANVPIIAVTAHATAEDRLRYEQAGINHFVAKPFKMETLRKLIVTDATA